MAKLQEAATCSVRLSSRPCSAPSRFPFLLLTSVPFPRGKCKPPVLPPHRCLGDPPVPVWGRTLHPSSGTSCRGPVSSLQGVKSQRSFLCMHGLELQNSILQIKMLASLRERAYRKKTNTVCLHNCFEPASLGSSRNGGVRCGPQHPASPHTDSDAPCTFTFPVLSQRKQQAQGKASTRCRINEAWRKITTCPMPS